MIKIGQVRLGEHSHENMEEVLGRYMHLNHIFDEDVISLVPDRDNPRRELHIYYKARDYETPTRREF